MEEKFTRLWKIAIRKFTKEYPLRGGDGLSINTPVKIPKFGERNSVEVQRKLFELVENKSTMIIFKNTQAILNHSNDHDLDIELLRIEVVKLNSSDKLFITLYFDITDFLKK